MITNDEKNADMNRLRVYKILVSSIYYGMSCTLQIVFFFNSEIEKKKPQINRFFFFQ